MNTGNIETVLESIMSNKASNTGKFNETNFSGVEGSRIPRQRISELLEEIIGSTGRFNMKTGGESPMNWGDRFNVKHLSDEELKEVLYKLLALKEGGSGFPSGLFSGFSTSFLGSPSYPRSFAHTPFMNVFSFNKIHLMNVNELKQFIRMWIKQLTFDVLRREYNIDSSFMSFHDQHINIDKHLIKKILVKFIDLIEYNCEKHVDRQTVMEILRQIEVFEVIEQAVYECKVWIKVYGALSQRPYGSEEVTELVMTVLREVLRRREGGRSGFFSGRDRMDSPYDFGNRRVISQLIELLTNEDDDYRRRYSEFGRRNRFNQGRDEELDFLKYLLQSKRGGLRSGMWEDEDSSNLDMWLNKMRRRERFGGEGSGWRNNVWNEDDKFFRRGGMEPWIHEILGGSPYQQQRFGGNRFGQKHWESSNVDSLVDLLKWW